MPDSVSSYHYQKLIFYVNGKRIEEADVDPKTTLAVYLRDHLKLTGTKIGCNEGGCGACTVMISEVDVRTERIKHYSANSCLMPICGVFGKAVTTVEGLGSNVEQRLHPVQERLAITHGSQCGFCTPGFVMAMYSLLRNKPKPTEKDINEAMQGNLCRCTGYRPILEAFYSFAVDESGDMKVKENGCGMGEKCCKVNGNSECGSGGRKELLAISDLSNCAKYDPSQELIFPPELQMKGMHLQSFALKHNATTWFQPTDYASLLSLKRMHPYARLISGNSELAVELKFRFIDLQMVINPKQVPELHEAKLDKNHGIYLGTGLSLTDMDDALQQYCQLLDDEACGVFRSVHWMMHWFAGKHVRNVASVAGNIATASPISDLNPIWMAANAEVVLESEERGQRTLPIDDKFFLGYRKTVIATDEVIRAIWIPITKKDQHFCAYKQAQRREDDIAIVTGAFCATVNPTTLVIEETRIAFGGMAPTTKLALNTMKNMIGEKFGPAMLDKALTLLAEEFALPPGVPGGMSRYRLSLCLAFFMKFYLHVVKALNIEAEPHREELTKIGLEIPDKLDATQLYQEVDPAQSADDACGRALPHVSGKRHVTGEAKYCNDVDIPDCLHMAFVCSPVACGSLDSIDPTAALQMDGVVGCIDASDVKKGVKIGHSHDTPVFPEDRVTYHCQPVAAIIAKDHETARRGANAVKVNITREKPIVSIEDAIAAKSYLLPDPFVVHSSLLQNPEVVKHDWSKYDHVVEGEIKMGGQEHFYLETQQCVVIPHEEDELEIIASTQGVNDVQMEVAKCLGIPAHKIVCKVRRIGGGFGGKETAGAMIGVPAAIAARKFRKPVRITLERFDDMAITGTRHPFRFNYRVATNKEGKLLDYDVTAYANCGHTFDLSIGVTHRAMVHIDNCYKFANADITGIMCKTNTASNTAYRGFGGPQGMFCAETLMQHVSETTGIDPVKLREMNFYSSGDFTPFGMQLKICNARRTWDDCKKQADYDNRKKTVEQYNRQNKYRKRGLFMMPTRFGIGFGIKQLNQGTALVMIYTDGSVLISHGGMEMGQGLHTKCLQIASRCLSLPIDKIHIHETSTDKVPNASATAASVGSDLYGLAVQNACDQLNERLAPLKKENPNDSWEVLINKAYMDRVSLTAAGFSTLPYEAVNFRDGKGAQLFNYCVYGTACCEVEVDCLTGDHHLLQTDIVMDVGESLNPAIDIGQIEGAFVQGYGLFTMEEIKVRPDGIRLTRGPGNYKIPSADDAPRKFHVGLLRGSANPRAIFSSKAIGEPPLFLGACAFFAIRDAVKAYRKDKGHDAYFRFDSPATSERIRIACEDEILDKIPKLPEEGTYTPWTVDL